MRPTLFNIITSYDGDASRLFDAMSVKPPAQDRYRYDQAVRRLKQAGLWNRIDLFYAPGAAATRQAGLLNWKNPAQSLTVVGTVTFTPYRGEQANGTDGGLSTGVAHNALTNAVQNSTVCGVWLNAGTDAASDNDPAIGIVTGTLRLSLVPRAASDLIGGRINASSGMGMGASTTILGHTAASRTASDLTTGYKNGIAASTSATTSAAPNASVLSFLYLTTNFSDFRLAAGYVGAGQSAQDQAAMHFTLRELLAPVGAA